LGKKCACHEEYTKSLPDASREVGPEVNSKKSVPSLDSKRKCGKILIQYVITSQKQINFGDVK
jgi:hypothetical protein